MVMRGDPAKTGVVRDYRDHLCSHVWGVNDNICLFVKPGLSHIKKVILSLPVPQIICNYPHGTGRILSSCSPRATTIIVYR